MTEADFEELHAFKLRVAASAPEATAVVWIDPFNVRVDAYLVALDQFYAQYDAIYDAGAELALSDYFAARGWGNYNGEVDWDRLSADVNCARKDYQ